MRAELGLNNAVKRGKIILVKKQQFLLLDFSHYYYYKNICKVSCYRTLLEPNQIQLFVLLNCEV